VLLLGLVLGGGALLWFVQGWNGAGPAQNPIEVQVAPGSSLSSAARTLEAAGAIRSASRFLSQARVLGSGAPIRAGEYRVPARASHAQILGLLQGGKVLQRLVVVPEGLPSVLVHERLMRAPGLIGAVPVPAEGSILPDSYAYQRDESRVKVVARMQAAMTETLDALWAKRAAGLPVSSKAEALALASIIEKETGKPSERRMVAGVYTNRLRVGMKLQADPTVIYPVTLGRPLGRRIRVSERDADNGYNTYAMPGLPRGPITNPGRESIAAALNPAATGALFMVADGTGGHVFADTLAQHEANRAKWYAIRRARGEM